MSKTISAALLSHIQGEVTTLATLWRITRTDGEEFFFTDHDQSITYQGNTYLADVGYQRTAINNTSNFAVDNLDITGVLLESESINEDDLRVGLFDFASVEIIAVNYNDLSQGDIKLRKGRIGEVTLDNRGTFQSELRGQSQLLSQTIGEVYSPECRADLGDSRCKVPIQPPVVERETAYSVGDFVRVATGSGTGSEVYENRIYECTSAGTTAASAPTYSTPVGNATTDGSAQFTSRQAWTRSAQIDSITDRRVFTLKSLVESRAADGWFNLGVITFESGDNAGFSTEIKSWTQSTSTIELYDSAPFAIATDDVVSLYPGCDKRIGTCQMKFALADTIDFSEGNVRNYRGEPNIPGGDILARPAQQLAGGTGGTGTGGDPRDQRLT